MPLALQPGRIYENVIFFGIIAGGAYAGSRIAKKHPVIGGAVGATLSAPIAILYAFR